MLGTLETQFLNFQSFRNNCQILSLAQDLTGFYTGNFLQTIFKPQENLSETAILQSENLLFLMFFGLFMKYGF